MTFCKDLKKCPVSKMNVFGFFLMQPFFILCYVLMNAAAAIVEKAVAGLQMSDVEDV